LNLRGDVASPTFVDAVTGVLGGPLPVQHNTVADHGEVRIFWLGPDEWLITTPEGARSDLKTVLQEALEGIHFALSDVSSGQTTLVVSGPDAGSLLSKSCTLDLHPRAFAPGQCAQTLLAGSTVLLSRLERAHGPEFELVVRRSFADYLWRCLADGAEEYQPA
jgi:sarcosine oxidase subunit gamma